jgi:sulfofructose kinase
MGPFSAAIAVLTSSSDALTMISATACIVDVLCVGYACYDLVFGVDHHPAPDEKAVAKTHAGCGGGPAANAAVAAARLGAKTAFIGYLGDDLYGRAHLAELVAEGIDAGQVLTGSEHTPVSAVLVKPDGMRTVVNYRGAIPSLDPDHLDIDRRPPRVILFDGHQPKISLALAEKARAMGIPTILDAGSVHEGTLALLGRVDVLAASRRFAEDLTGTDDEGRLADRLAVHAPWVVVTLGSAGLVWKRGQVTGRQSAYPVVCMDSTGAGDAFHGALAAGWAMGMQWPAVLRFASAAGALCCTVLGARNGMPSRTAVEALMRSAPS